MADQKLSQLTAAAVLTGAELVYVVQSGNQRRTTTGEISATTPGTDLSFTAATRTLTSSTGADVVLPVATTTDAGLKSAADKTKLDGVATGATVNSPDATLLARANHTGTQAAGTITGLATVATTGAYADLSGKPTLGTAAATASTDYAPAAQGVTNGNSHDHSGGDGTQIAYSSLSGLPTLPTGINTGDQTLSNTSSPTSHTVTLSGSGGSLQLVEGSNVTLTTSGTASAAVVTIAASVTGGGGGTVTSIGLIAPAGFSVSGSPVTTSGDITLSFAAGYSLPTTVSQTSWDTAFTERRYWDGGPTGLNAATGRTSLGLGGAATLNVGTSAGTVAAGDDARITGALAAATAATTYQLLNSNLTAIAALSTTTFGRSQLTQADAATARSNLGAAAAGAIGSSGLTMATARMLGRSTASAGAAEEITVGSGLSLSGGTLSATGGGGGTSNQQYAAGYWLAPLQGSVVSATAMVANVIYFHPFVLARSITVGELGVRINTVAAGSSIQLAIYATLNGEPNGAPLGSSVSLSSATVGVVSDNLTDFNLTGGVTYWMATISDGTPALQHVSGTTINIPAAILGAPTLAQVSSASTSSGGWRSVSQTFGTWPTLTAGATTVQTGGARGGIVYLQVAALL